jgi:hypothetical protein
MNKHTCEHRKVSRDGRIICSKIALGDNQVSPNLCRDCPAKACDCGNLRFCLQKSSLSPVVVRWGNGNTEVWDDQPPAISFLHSACNVRTIPISSPGDCMGCVLREGALAQEEIHTVPQEAVAVAQDNVIPFVKVGP